MMESTTMWIAMSFIATPFVIFLYFIYRVVKCLLIEANSEAQNDPKKHLKVTTPSWELVTDDEFGGPFCSRLLFAIVGSGVQNVMYLLVFLLASFPLYMGIQSPKYERAATLVTSILYSLLAFVAGYTGSVLTKTLKPSCMSSKDWIQVSSLITLLTCLHIHSLIESGILVMKASDAMVSFVMWLCILIPITFLGGYFGRHGEPISLPILTNRTINVVTRSSVLIVAAGYFTSLICCIEVLNILEISWRQNSILQSVPLLIVLAILEVSMCGGGLLLMHMQLSAGEVRCRWWKALLSFGGPFGVLEFFSSINWQLLGIKNWNGLALFTANLFCSLATSLEDAVTKGTLGLVLMFIIYSFSSRVHDTFDLSIDCPVEKL